MQWNLNWFVSILDSSIGKKLFMALTGLGFCAFLIGHLAGNLTILAGKDTFNSYAERLHALGPLVNLVEIGLLFFGSVHIVTGTCLFYENLRARPEKYLVKENAGGRTIGSGTMPYTGFFILVFVIFHLLDFHFIDRTDQNIYQVVSDTFSNIIYASFYIISMAIIAIHVSHGFWSAFQTLGANNSEYIPFIRVIGIIFSLVIGIGFGLIPVYVLFIS